MRRAGQSSTAGAGRTGTDATPRPTGGGHKESWIVWGALVATIVLLAPGFESLLGGSASSADAGADAVVDVGIAVRFDGSRSRVALPLNHTWFFGDGAQGHGAVTTHPYGTLGVYQVTLVVRDANGWYDLDTVDVTVRNDVPVARAGADRTAAEDEIVGFDGSSSSDTGDDAPRLTYAWEFGDGSTANGVRAGHAFARAGSYPVALTAYDDQGMYARDYVLVDVANVPPVAVARGPDTAWEDEALTFDGTSSKDTPSDAARLRYGWEFGDGSRGAGAVVTHAYARQGTYVVTLTVTDDNGAQSYDSTRVTVVNLPPTASAGPDVVVSEGKPGMFDGSGSEDTPSDEPSLRYEWIRSPAVAPNPYPAIPGWGATHTWFDDGAHDVVLRVTDGDGAESLDLVSVTVSNVPPRATITGFWWFADGILVEGRVFDPGADDLTFVWEQGGHARNEWYSPSGGDHPRRVTAYAFLPWSAAPPVSPITLTVLDDDGGAGTDTIQIVAAKAGAPARPVCAVPPIIPTSCRLPPPDREMVDNLGPRVNAGLDVAATEDLTMPFYAVLEDRDSQAVVDPRPPAIPVHPDPDHEYEWTFGDGATASGNPVFHAISKAGTYTVVVTVTDRKGSVASDGVLATVENLAPIASFSLLGGVEDELLAFTSTAEDTPSDADQLEHEWSFSDGAMANGMSPSHTFTDDGPAWVRLRVYDDNGETGEMTTALDVANAPPTIAVGPVHGDQDEPLVFAATVADSPSDTPYLSVSWEFGDGGLAVGRETVHRFERSGAFVGIASVSDGSVGTQVRFDISIANPPPKVFVATPVAFYGAAKSYSYSASAYDTYSDAVDFLWDFGSGFSPSAMHAHRTEGTHAFQTKGRDLGGGERATSFTANVILDADGDQLRDSIERNGGTDPAEWDSDGDGIPDNYELSSLDVEECARRYGVENCRTDPRVFDTDNDGLSDWEELWPGEDGYLTMPTNPDTDRDGLSDGQETSQGYYILRTGIAKSIPDARGQLPGAVQVALPRVKVSAPSNAVITIQLHIYVLHDRISDVSLDIVRGSGAWVSLPRPDQNRNSVWYRSYDLLELPYSHADFNTESTWVVRFTDSQEGILGRVGFVGIWAHLRTDPTNPDSDADGLRDSLEVVPASAPAGEPADPLGFRSDPWNEDTDGDALSDFAEGTHGTNPLRADSDADALSDGSELFVYGTSPTQGDSDQDGARDSREVLEFGLGDPDADGLANPVDEDSDGDFLRDGSDPQPLTYNAPVGSAFTWDAMTVNNELHVSVAIDYAGTGLPPVISPWTPPVPLPRPVGRHFEVTASGTVSKAVILVDVRSALAPDDPARERLSLYKWDPVLHDWRYQPFGGVVSRETVWLETTGFSHFGVTDGDLMDSDGDGLSDWAERSCTWSAFCPWNFDSRTSGDSSVPVDANVPFYISNPRTTKRVPSQELHWFGGIVWFEVDILGLGFPETEMNAQLSWSVSHRGQGILTMPVLPNDWGVTHQAWLSFGYCHAASCAKVQDDAFMTFSIQGSTDPLRADTDGDGFGRPSGWDDADEVNFRTNPISKDPDRDGIWDPADFNPLRDLTVTVGIDRWRELDPVDANGDCGDYYARIAVDEVWWTSPEPGEGWNCGEYPGLRHTWDVPDDRSSVVVKIQMWDDDTAWIDCDDLLDISIYDTPDGDRVCDATDLTRTLYLIFSLRSGGWYGDDFRGDANGFQHVSGDEDGSTGNDEDDAEVWFHVRMNDVDDDGFGWWTESHDNDPATDPLRDDDPGDPPDTDRDGMWDSWEDQMGLDLSVNDASGDPDRDGLSNLAEFRAETDPHLWDTDRDFLPDGYEESDIGWIIDYERSIVADDLLLPLRSSDARPYVRNLRDELLTFAGNLMQDSRMTDYDWLLVHLPQTTIEEASQVIASILGLDGEGITQLSVDAMLEVLAEHFVAVGIFAETFGLLDAVKKLQEAGDYWANVQELHAESATGCAASGTPHDPLMSRPGYIYLVGYATGCSTLFPRQMAEFDWDGNLIGGISWDLLRIAPLSPAEFRFFVDEARTMLSRWWVATGSSGTVSLPVKHPDGTTEDVDFPYTGYKVEDDALSFADRLWKDWWDESRAAGSNSYWLIPPCGLSSCKPVNVVALEAVQWLIQSYLDLRAIRELLDKVQGEYHA